MISNNLKLIATVSLDFYTNNIKTINVKQYDSKSRYIQVSFTEHGKKVELNKDTLSVITRYKKSDGKFGLQDCEILDDGTVMIQTTEQMLAVSGRCRLDVVILESNGLNVENFCDVTSFDDIDCAILSTMPLDLNVIACPVNDGELQSEYDFTALNESLAATKAAEEDMIAKNKEWAKAEEERTDAERKREQNVTNLINNCQSEVNEVIQACQEKTDDAIQNASDATTSANNAATSADNAASNANSATDNANNAATYATAEAQKCKDVYQAISEGAEIVISECETARDRANAAAKDCEDIVAGIGVVMQTEKGVAGGVASLDETGKVPESQLPELYKSEGEESFATNDRAHAIGDYSFAVGIDTIAGCKGYYIKSIDMTNKKIYLCNEKVLPVISEDNNSDTSFETPAYKAGDKFNIISGSHYILCGTITAILNNVVSYDGDLGFTELVNDTGVDGNTFSVPSKPTIGIVQIGDYASVEGQSNISAGKRSHSEGRGNLSAGAYAHTEGNMNIAGYAAHAEGHLAQALGDYSHAEGRESVATGQAAHVEGTYNQALGDFSHAEGRFTIATGMYAHTEGYESKAVGMGSHAEGYSTEANKDYAHAEGVNTEASGSASHAEGKDTHAMGSSSHAEGKDTHANKDYSHAEGNGTEANELYAHAEGQGTKANGFASHAEGVGTEANKSGSHAEGNVTKANGSYSHAEGHTTEAIGVGSHAEGLETHAIGNYSHAEGNNTFAEGTDSHAEGESTTAGEAYSHAEGQGTKAMGYASHAEGVGTIVSGAEQHVQGRFNKEVSSTIYAHVVGNGSDVAEKYRSNAHTLDWKGNAWYQGSVTSNGADYAEFFEWEDGNHDNEDRVGLLVTLDGEKIKLANSGNEILGIISGTAAVLGDNYECEWNGKYLTDDFGRVIYDMVEKVVEIPHIEVDDEGNKTESIEIKSLGFFEHPRINPNYDPEQEYVNRSDRPEWDTVGMLGKLYVRDDGTCQVNEYATVGVNGVATASSEKTNMRVLSRVNEKIVRVLMK